MENLLKAPSYVLLFAIIISITVTADGQEFKGFYGSNNTVNYSGDASRYYKPGYSKHRRRHFTNTPPFYGGSPTVNAAGVIIQPFQGFYPSTYPAGITIHILPAAHTPLGMYNYYDGRDRNDWDFNNYNRLPNGNRTVRINGDRFYEMDGNFYRADYIPNRYDRNMPGNRYSKDRYDWNDRYDNDNRVMYVSGDDRNDNGRYVSRDKEPSKIVYVDNVNEGNHLNYPNAQQVTNTLLATQREQDALELENRQLRKAEQQRLENERELIDAERKRLIKENEQAREELDETKKFSRKEINAERERQSRESRRSDEELNDIRKRSAREIEADRARQTKENKQPEPELNNMRKRNAQQVEQARRDQQILDEKRVKEQREADREYEKRQMQAARNYSNDNELYSNVEVGNTVDRLPKNSREIKIDGKKTYVSPGNVYYRKQQGRYRVVGMQ